MSAQQAVPADARRSPELGVLAPVGLLALALAWLGWQVLHLASSGITVFVDEAYYWGWSRELAWGYYSKPPMIAALIAAGTAVLGQNFWGIKLPVLLCYPVAALVLACLVREQYPAGSGRRSAATFASQHAALATAACFLAAPVVLLVGLFASTDAPLLLCWTVATWCAWRATQRDSRAAWWGLGMAVGLGMLSKYTMAVFGLSMLAWLAADAAARRRWWTARARVVQAMVLALIFVAPHLYWNHAQSWPTIQHTAEITAPGSGTGGWIGLLQFAAAQALVPGWLIWAGVWRRERVPSSASALEPSATRMAWALVWPLLVLSLLQAARAGAQVNWAAPALVGLSLLAGPRLASLGSRGRRWAALALVSQLLVCACFVHARELARAMDHPRWGAVDPLARMRGWDRALADLRPIAMRMQATHGRLQLLSMERGALAHAAYHWRDLNPQPHGWRPQVRVTDHFQLRHPLRAHAPGPWLYVGEAPPPSDILMRFGRHGAVETAVVPLGPGRSLRLHVQALDAFEGYAP